MAESVFKFVRVYPALLGGTLVEWFVHPAYPLPATGKFVLEWAHSGSPRADDWRTAVDDIPLTTNAANDPVQRVWGQSADLYYRVRIVSTDTPSIPDVYSQGEPAWGSWCRQDYLWAREEVRKQLLHMRKGHAGSNGLLFRRRHWGTPCTNAGCRNKFTDEVQKGQCPVCFSTGFVGGYFPGIPFCFIENPPSTKTHFDQGLNTGMTKLVAKSATAMAFPMPESYDFILENNTDRRLIIGGIQTLSAIRGIPLIIGLELKEAPITDIRQSIPHTHGLTV